VAITGGEAPVEGLGSKCSRSWRIFKVVTSKFYAFLVVFHTFSPVFFLSMLAVIIPLSLRKGGIWYVCTPCLQVEAIPPLHSPAPPPTVSNPLQFWGPYFPSLGSTPLSSRLSATSFIRPTTDAVFSRSTDSWRWTIRNNPSCWAFLIETTAPSLPIGYTVGSGLTFRIYG